LLGVMLLLEGVEARGQTNSRTPGTVVSWGTHVIPYVQPLTRFKAIAAGGNHNLALRLDGTVVAWGNSYSGEANVPSRLGSVVAIAAGSYHSLALNQDGTVVAWGAGWMDRGCYPGCGRSVVARGLGCVVSLLAGGYRRVR